MPVIGVIGAGSIGSVLAAGYAKIGYDVVVNDQNPDVMDALPHPGVSKDEIASIADWILVAVPTPTASEGGDFTAVENVIREIQDTDATVILRSTMPPGSTWSVASEYEIPLIYSPEFLRDRSTVDDFFRQDRVVIAGPPERRDHADVILTHDTIDYDQVIETHDYLTAELGKYAHNAFFATKVSFANQMRMIAERGGADPETVMDIVTADDRNTSSHLDPMLGAYGGKCLPKDLGALTYYGAAELRAPIPLLEAVKRVNDLASEEFDEFDITGNYPNLEVVHTGD